MRGNGFYGVGAQDDRYTDAHFERFNRNERKDDRILMHLPALNAEIIRLSVLVQSVQ
ncbi:MAG TPA: hypothetical protein VLA51_13195 [Paracoccaceae bacterium]|nr:hypothetical protein [Paracoccaceae bacterium]